jgi:hypothetical protein
MSKARPITGNNGLPLPILPPDRDARVWANLVPIMFYTPGFMGLLLIKTGEPASFGITIELLMLASASAIVGGIYIGTESTAGGANTVSRVGTASGSLILELLAVVPFLAALPGLFHELAHSTLVRTHAPSAVDVALGASELLPMVAILPFMLTKSRHTIFVGRQTVTPTCWAKPKPGGLSCLTLCCASHNSP